jgi:hypothetical protein
MVFLADVFRIDFTILVFMNMRRFLIFLSLSLTISVSLFAQTPSAFKYQTVCRDASGVILPNQMLGFRLSLLQGSPNGPAVFSETHSTVSNDFGVVNLNVGQGNSVQGNIQNLDWINNSYFLKVEFDPAGQSNYLFMGSSQIMAVPYALNAQHAKQAERSLNDQDTSSSNEIQTLSIVGNQLQISGGNSVTFTGVVDLDADPSNELQVLQLSNDTLFLSSGNFVVLPPDADGDSINELQNLIPFGDSLKISLGNAIATDNSVTNEIQSISFLNDSLRLSLGGGVVFLPIKTPWNLINSILDPGDDQTSSIYRNGSIGLGDLIGADTSAILELNDTTRGLLLTRLTENQKNSIPNPKPGLIIYNKTKECYQGYFPNVWKNLACKCDEKPNSEFTAPYSVIGLGTSVTFIAADSTNQLNWTIPTGSPSMDSSGSPTIVFNQLGQTAIKLISTNVHGCKDSTIKLISVQNCLLNASINHYPDTPAVNQTVQFSSLSNPNMVYQWTFSSGQPGSANQLQSTSFWNQSGNFWVKLLATDTITGCQSIDSTLIVIQNCVTGDSAEFNFNGQISNWVVPPGVCSVTIEAWGAKGGVNGGFGGYEKGQFSVLPGDTLHILVGGAGANGGGNSNGGGGGGGGTFIVNKKQIPLIVAGGGGAPGAQNSIWQISYGGFCGEEGCPGYGAKEYFGALHSSARVFTIPSGNGGSMGGGGSGGDATASAGGFGAGGSGGGGFQGSGSLGINLFSFANTAKGGFSYLKGGLGGGNPSPSGGFGGGGAAGVAGFGGGGGGGGYSGGGGGGGAYNNFGAAGGNGGGGGSFNSGLNKVSIAGGNSTQLNGKVLIYW